MEAVKELAARLVSINREVSRILLDENSEPESPEMDALELGGKAGDSGGGRIPAWWTVGFREQTVQAIRAGDCIQKREAFALQPGARVAHVTDPGMDRGRVVVGWVYEVGDPVASYAVCPWGQARDWVMVLDVDGGIPAGILLEIRSIEAEPLQGMTEGDAKACGVGSVAEFQKIWDQDHAGHAELLWDRNPWAWVMMFKVLPEGVS